MSLLRGKLFQRLDESRLRLLFLSLFVALAIPAAVLMVQAYDQLKWEAFRSTQLAAEELAARIDSQLRAATATEEARSFGDYSFLVVTGDAAANFVQRSPLSDFPAASGMPGVLGYFQVDAAGQLTTPLLPEDGIAAASYGISAADEAARAARVAELREVLAQNQLIRPQARSDDDGATGTARRLNERVIDTVATSPPAELPASAESSDAQAQAAFDRLAGGARSAARVQNVPASLAVQSIGSTATTESPGANRSVPAAFESRAAPGTDERQKRVEQTFLPEPEAATADSAIDASEAPKRELRVRTFESEVDPFELGTLDTGHLVLFRNVWRDSQRYIQGALIDRAAFVTGVVETPYRVSGVAQVSDLSLTFQGAALATLSAAPANESSAAPRELAGTLLHRARLSPPFGDLELQFGVHVLPRAPGTALLAWISVILATVLCGGFLLMYRLASGQLRLARQQQDFVSAVSHELKTPLTSIRMYGEMLKSGWADEARKQTYYEYIHGESERLSRLIDNVLQLARLTRNSQQLDIQRLTVAELIDLVRSKIGTPIEQAGFELRIRNEAPADATLKVDADCFVQIVINLVDNALKFAAAAETRALEILCRRETDGSLLFTVRDFGPGVPRAQMKKIFELFYRPADELTRETVGTGIGLALVRQLAEAMGARIEVRNCEPGAEFRLRFPK